MPSPPRPLARLFAPTPRTVERETLDIELSDGRTVPLQRVRDPRARRMKLSVDELRYMAAKALLPEKLVVSTALEIVDRFQAVWQREKKNLPLAANVIEAVEQHFAKLAITKKG